MIDKLKELKSKATRGIWRVGYGNGITGPRVSQTVYLDGVGGGRLPIRQGNEAIAWILHDGDSRVAADAQLICEAVNNLDALLEVVESAIGYINESPCDPDIYPEQIKAWDRYQKALVKLEE